MKNYAMMLREEFGKGDCQRDAGLETPEDVKRFDDIKIDEAKQIPVIDIYRPKEKAGKLPVIVNVHGGGLVYGTKETYQFYCMELARMGFAVVNFTYRLAPENPWPAMLQDTCEVFNWVLEESTAETYGLDTDHIFAVGDSAGATLLGQYSNLCTNKDYKVEGCHPKPGFAPTAIALNCGHYLYTLEDGGLTENLMPYIFKGKGTPQELDQASVLPHITPGFPPTFAMTCEYDFLKGQMLPLLEVLLEKNVPFTAEYFTDSTEELGHVFHCNVKDRIAMACNKKQACFFKSFLTGE